jgi:formylglycine-generating enzyme required for sulfatase activity
MAFCAWDGAYLATEAEWNFAAAGGDQQLPYPWASPASSTAIDGSHASYFDGTNCVGDGMAGCALTDLVAVGTKPAGDGRWGHSDLAGNVAEWTLDWTATYALPCMDCAALTATATRTIRGGNYNQAATVARTTTRGSFPPASRFPGVGARCARAP